MEKLELLLGKLTDVENFFVRNKTVSAKEVKEHFNLCLKKGIDEYNALKTIFILKGNSKINLLCWE